MKGPFVRPASNSARICTLNSSGSSWQARWFKKNKTEMLSPLIQYPLITHLCNYFCYPVPRPPSWSCEGRLKITIIIIIIIRTARKKNHQTRRPVTGPNHHQAVCDFYTGGDRISKYPMGPRLCEARDITDRIYFGWIVSPFRFDVCLFGLVEFFFCFVLTGWKWRGKVW